MIPIFSFVILIFSVIVHEIAHGYMAEYLGDPTARLLGRLTLNPIPHIDIMGSIVLPVIFVVSGSPVLFGWAKPVPYNPQNIRGSAWKERYGGALVAFAGPGTNLLIATVFGILIRMGAFPQHLVQFFLVIVIINIALAVFNLIPVPPFDGHHILASVLPYKLRKMYESLYQYSFILIFIVAFVLWQFISPIIFIIARAITGL